jgi:hypothetical protein
MDTLSNLQQHERSAMLSCESNVVEIEWVILYKEEHVFF